MSLISSCSNSDFFPYDDVDRGYWSGYYSSRTAMKGWVRSRENFLRVAKTLHALQRISSGYRSNDTSQVSHIQQARVSICNPLG